LPIDAPAADPGGASGTLHGVQPGAPPDRFAAVPDGSSPTRLDVEVCAGPAQLDLEPWSWYGRRDDGFTESATVVTDGLPVTTLPSGQCARGSVDVVIPDGHALVEAVWVDPQLHERGRWSIA